MLLTSVDPRAHQQHQQEVSKLSQWLAIKSDNLAEESTAQNQQQLATNSIATNFYSNGHAQPASFASAEHSSDFSSADGRSSSLSMVDTGSIGSQATRRNWNVHANPFHPTAYQMMGPQNGAFVRPKQEAIAMRMEQPAQMKMGMEPFMGHGQPQNDGGIFQSFPPVGQPQFAQQSHQQNFFQQMPGNGVSLPTENGNGLVDNNSNVWQDPNAELYRWQQYTGTGVWGKPEEKVTKSIKRWQDLTDTDEGIPQQNNTNGWGELPSITVGTYGRIQQLQHFGGRSTPTIQTGGGNVDFRPNQAQMPQIFPTLPHQQPQHFHGGIPQAQLGHGIGLGGGSRISGPVAPTPKWSSFEPVDPMPLMMANGGGQYSAAMVFPGQGMNMNAGGFGFVDNGFQGFIPKRNNFPLAMQPHHFACLPINGGPSTAGYGEA